MRGKLPKVGLLLLASAYFGCPYFGGGVGSPKNRGIKNLYINRLKSICMCFEMKVSMLGFPGMRSVASLGYRRAALGNVHVWYCKGVIRKPTT